MTDLFFINDLVKLLRSIIPVSDISAFIPSMFSRNDYLYNIKQLVIKSLIYVSYSVLHIFSNIFTSLKNSIGPFISLEIAIVFIIIWLISSFVYIKLQYPFWNLQPVFHSYYKWTVLFSSIFPFSSGSPYIIQKLPIKNKFCNFDAVITKTYSTDYNNDNFRELVYLLQNHSIKSDSIIYTITEQNLKPFLIGHNDPVYISMFYENIYVYNNDISGQYNIKQSNIRQSDKIQSNIKQSNIIQKPIGSIISRPMDIIYSDKNKEIINIKSYYWDYICINREQKNKTKIYELIQTHEYSQRIKSPDISISIFKREANLCEGIVPLVEYDTYTFYLDNQRVIALPDHFIVIIINNTNYNILFDFLREHQQQQQNKSSNRNNFDRNNLDRNNFDFYITPCIGSLISLIETNNIFVYCLKKREHIYGLYFIKNTQRHYEDPTIRQDKTNGINSTKSIPINGINSISLISSINNSTSKTLFIQGFIFALRDILKFNSSFKMLNIENLAHNPQILEHFILNNNPIDKTKTAYYLYNYYFPGSPISIEKLFVIT
jgi:hypothetical protein